MSIALDNALELRSTQQVLGGVSLGTFTLNHATPSGRIEYPDTNPQGWNTGIGRMTFDAEFISNSYFAANPEGHFALVLRQDMALSGTSVRGQGVAVGNTTGFPWKPSDLNPTPLLETWFNGMGNNNFTYPNSEAARSQKMADGVPYRIIVDSLKANDGNRYLRYRLYSKDVTYGDWVALVDTGDVLDFNVYADLTKTGFIVGQVFESNLVTWSLVFTNAKITWGPAENSTPDQTSKLSRYGAQLDGNLTFTAGRNILFPANAGPSLATSLAVQSATPNTGTVLVVKPNGSSNVANHLYTNSSASTTTYQAVTFGMTGTTALLETLGLAAANPVFGVNIGAGNRVATFKTDGMTLLSATKSIGSVIGYSINITNWGGTNASLFSQTWTMDIDALSAVGAIAGTLGGSYSPSNIENAVRPLYCLLSFLIKNLQDKKVI